MLPSEKENICREHGSHLALQASGISPPPARIRAWVSVLSAPPLDSVKGLSQRTGLGLSKSCSGSLELEVQRLWPCGMVTQVILSGGHLFCLQSGYHTGWTPASITGTVLTLPSPAAQGATLHAAPPQRLFCHSPCPEPDPLPISCHRASGGGRGDPTAAAHQERCGLCDPEAAQEPGARRGPEDPEAPLLHQRALLQPQGDGPPGLSLGPEARLGEPAPSAMHASHLP